MRKVLLNTTAFFTMENYGKDSQEVKTEGEGIRDGDISWKLRGQLADTEHTVDDGDLEVKN